ncbi:hypothetical protein G3480_01910 [Thiorhodococcus mannitoliphagus]|uniref:Uncharacterized protein n=1 Tax=Thiorhodococcus mannitoliphagus TaxID=329406 RepID=A0A6P1DQX1_9GAMM|nr:hypothetical protein [Thiorhodococcus mannitoliphagus]NEX19076.1 hypothetical protein [Thiorhodococcus mannitoliphagus]
MDTGAAKAIEAIVIGALVVGFYLQQQRAVTAAKSDDAKNRNGEASSAAAEAPKEADQEGDPH